jgi:predicted RecA/RadA family phage recombinase
MATNKLRWIRNLNGAPGPLVMLGLFKAGSTQAIKRGEILEFTNDWVPIDSDFAMDSEICVAHEEIKAGDRAGYYEIIVPRPGDVFEFDLATAGATAVGTALYYSSSEAVTVSAGSNIIGYAVGQEHFPQKQGHLADDASGDAGVTIKSISVVRMVFTRAASLWSLFQV